jgi:hypothetical protein
MSADSPPPSPTSDIQEDAVAAYQRDISQILSAAPDEAFVDPHVSEATATDPDDVDARSHQSDVDPVTRFDVGPSDDELAAGEEVTPSAAPTATGEGDGGLPADPASADPSPVADDVSTPPARSPAASVAELASQLRVANPDLSEPEAQELAARALAAPASPPPAAPAAPALPVPAIAALETERQELDRAWRKGVRELLPDEDLERMETRIAEIDALIPKARDEEVRQIQQRHAAYEASASRAIELYPEAGREGSALFKRMEQIHAALEASNDPLIHDASKPLVIAQMAARELRIAPHSGPAAVAPAKPAATPAVRPRSGGSAPMTAPLAGASARPAAPTPNGSEKAIEQIQTPEQYEALMHGLRRRR